MSQAGSCRVCSGRLGCIRLFWPFETLPLTCWVCKDLLAVLWDLGRAIVPWGVCFVCVDGPCKCIRCVLCVTAHLDIVALLGALSRAGLTWGTSLSTWESPWKRAPKVTPGRFSPRAGRGRPAGGTQAHGRDANVHGRDASCPRVGRRWDSKLSSLLSRSIYQAKTGGAM